MRGAASVLGGIGLWRLAAPLAVVATLASGCTAAADDPGAPVPVDPAAIYAQQCARCHGADGRGDAQMKAAIPVRDFSDPAFRIRRNEELERTIMKGRGQMPGFGGALSQPKIQALVGFVKRLGAAAAAHP